MKEKIKLQKKVILQRNNHESPCKVYFNESLFSLTNCLLLIADPSVSKFSSAQAGWLMDSRRWGTFLKRKVELATSWQWPRKFLFVESRRSVRELRRKARRGTDCVSFFLQLNSPCFHSLLGPIKVWYDLSTHLHSILFLSVLSPCFHSFPSPFSVFFSRRRKHRSAFIKMWFALKA